MDLGNAGKQPNRAGGGLICNKMIYAVGLMEEYFFYFSIFFIINCSMPVVVTHGYIINGNRSGKCGHYFSNPFTMVDTVTLSKSI